MSQRIVQVNFNQKQLRVIVKELYNNKYTTNKLINKTWSCKDT
jgi:hypothetical protein